MQVPDLSFGSNLDRTSFFFHFNYLKEISHSKVADEAFGTLIQRMLYLFEELQKDKRFFEVMQNAGMLQIALDFGGVGSCHNDHWNVPVAALLHVGQEFKPIYGLSIDVHHNQIDPESS